MMMMMMMIYVSL